jgi:hypothetical protein
MINGGHPLRVPAFEGARQTRRNTVCLGCGDILGTMSLKYLDFEYSEDTEGLGTFEAMASTGAAQVALVRDEVAQVLAWAFEHFADGRGPLDEGFEWDYDLQSLQEWSQPEPLQYDPRTQKVTALIGLPGQPRHTVTLSLTGSEAFCAAFTQQFME